MLEILILIMLGRNIAAKARAKGRSGGWFVVLLLGLWFGGELFGGIAAGVVAMVAMGEAEPPFLPCYLGALVGAAVGAVIAFVIVNSVSPVRTYGNYDDDDFEEYGRDRKRPRDRDDEDRY